MMGLPQGWVTGVPDLTRNDQLKALGNGVVPQQAAVAIAFLIMYAGQPLTDGQQIILPSRSQAGGKSSVTGAIRFNDYDGDLLEGWAS